MTLNDQNLPAFLTLLHERRILECYALMMNDRLRNRFYSRMIKGNLKDKTVLDPGFGTGLLSFLAIRERAKQVLAFEERPDTFELGNAIVKEALSAEQISLSPFTYAGEPNDADCLIHENLGQRIWDERLFAVIKNLSTYTYPGEYFLRAHTRIVDADYLKTLGSERRNLMDSALHTLESEHALPFAEDSITDFIFQPGVDLPKDYVQSAEAMIQKLIAWRNSNSHREVGLEVDFTDLNRQGETAFYHVDVNQRTVETSRPSEAPLIQQIAELPKLITIPIFYAQIETQLSVSVEFGVGHDGDELILTENYSGKSWDQPQPSEVNRVMRVPQGTTLYLTQFLTDGSFGFHL